MMKINEILDENLVNVRITNSTLPKYIGFTGQLHTNLQNFHANAGMINMVDVLLIDKTESCIGIINKNERKTILWTRNSNFNIEIEKI